MHHLNIGTAPTIRKRSDAAFGPYGASRKYIPSKLLANFASAAGTFTAGECGDSTFVKS